MIKTSDQMTRLELLSECDVPVSVCMHKNKVSVKMEILFFIFCNYSILN